jgi:hypothetical protein
VFDRRVHGVETWCGVGGPCLFKLIGFFCPSVRPSHRPSVPPSVSKYLENLVYELSHDP